MPAKKPHPDAEFVAELVEQFAPLALVTPRAMFGGFGLFSDGAMFALVDDGAVYLKTDDVNCPAHEALGFQPWVYEAASKTATMSYYLIPEEALEDPEALRPWFEGALAAAQRAAAARKPRAKKGGS